jgi:iron complex transport system substrate-binding protein
MRKHTVKIYLSIVLFCLLIQGFGMPAHATGGESILIKDATGRSVEVRLPIRRVVILNSDVLEVIRALNAEDLVVGVNSGISISPSFWPGLKNIPSVGRWMEPNYELIAELNPDIVIGYARHPALDMEKKLMPFGITVIRLDFYKICALIEEVKILGRILGREEEARKLTTWYRKNLSSIQGSIKDISDRPDVYIESYSRYHTTGPNSGGHEMSILAGGHNIASDFSIPYPEITPEWILANNPHVIIKATALSNCYSMTDPRSLKIIRDEITDRTAWDNIQAVQEDRVYVMTSDVWTGPRAIIGIGYMAKWFHPDLFKNLDPEKLHREYLEKFQGIKYQGVYVYPRKVPKVISELK